MKFSSKITPIIALLALLGFGLLGYFILRNYYPGSGIESEKTIPSSIRENPDETSSGNLEEILDEEIENENAAEEEMFLEVLPEDCKNECKNFQVSEDIDYCKNICGLVTIKRGASECDPLKNLEKDYCLKDLAISKTDERICDQIEDFGIKKTCENNLAENIINEQKEL